MSSNLQYYQTTKQSSSIPLNARSSTEASSNNNNNNRSKYAKYTKHDKLCVCDICTCKTHKCPPPDLRYAPDALRSIMKTDYVPHQLSSRAQKAQLTYEPTSYNPDLLKTIHQVDYTPKQRSAAAQPFIPDDSILHSTIPFNAESEYKNKYLQYEPLANQRLPTPQSHPFTNHVPYNPSSTYTDSYQGLPGQKANQTTLQLPQSLNLPFNATSEYTEEYRPHDAKRQTYPRRPEEKMSYPFTGTTCYTDDYQPFDRSAYANDPCDINFLPERPRNCSPGKTHLHYLANVEAWE